MADDRTAEHERKSERTRQGQATPTLIGGVAAATRQAAQGTSATVGRVASEGRDATLSNLQQLSKKLEDAAQELPDTPASARTAWRAGRWLGRVEGVIWLSSRGAGIWWKQTLRRLRQQSPGQRTRLVLQWGPCAVATGWLVTQVVLRLRRRSKR